MFVGYWILILWCSVAGCLTLEIQPDGKSSVRSVGTEDLLAATKGHISLGQPVPIVSTSAVTTSLIDNLYNYLQQTATVPSSIWSWLTYVDKHMPLIQIYGTKPDIKPGDKPATWSGNIFKDFYKHIYKKIVKVYVALYGRNAIGKIDPDAKEEEDEDVLCIDEGEDKEQPELTTIQVDVLGQMFKYLTKYMVKKSYTPFLFVKDIFKYFGFIDPTEKHIQQESPNVIVIDVDPLTTLFTNIQRFFNAYEEVEKKEEETKLLNKLARNYVDVNKLTKKKPSGSKKPCVLKDPHDLWDEIAPYDSSLIFSNLVLVAVWLVAFWAPILPVLLSFPSRNGFGFDDGFDDGGFADGGFDDGGFDDGGFGDGGFDNGGFDDGGTGDGGNRRDQQHIYFDPYENQYVHADHGINIHGDSQTQNDIKSHIHYQYHKSPEATNDFSHPIHADHVNHNGAQAQEVAGAHNIAVPNDNSIDNQYVSSYTHYNANDIWHN